jgi:hypothetical protein
MGTMRTLRTVIALSFAVLSPLLHAQATGINITLDYGHRLVEDDRGFVPTATFGLGVQRDFDRRIGMGVDLFYSAGEQYSVNALEFIYSAKYFTSSNEYTSFYVGSLLGVQLLSGSGYGISGSNNGSVEVSHVQIPVGLRAGLRGGLDGYFGELFVQGGYAIGNGELYRNSAGSVNSAPLYFMVGLSFLGFGWE